MKICVVQPPYSYDFKDVQKNFSVLLSLLEQCDDSLDLIVLPEYSDIPADTHNNAEFFEAIEQNNPVCKSALRLPSDATHWCL